MPLNETGRELLGDADAAEEARQARRAALHEREQAEQAKRTEKLREMLTLYAKGAYAKSWESEATRRFPEDTAQHQLTVFHDDGLYRHLRFRAPAQSMYWYDLITWPGHLTVGGDMGTFVFARDDDMFAFFRSNPDRPRYRINPTYWGEKVKAGDKVEDFSQRVFRRSIVQYVLDRAEYEDLDVDTILTAVQEEIFSCDYDKVEALEALRRFEFGRFHFEDFWELPTEEFTFHFIWVCYAIVKGIEQYDQHRAEEAKRDDK